MKAFDAILIAGPTASGKSKLALELAQAHDGVVINADSMQIYAGLRILSARPAEAEMQGIPHRLYGYADPGQPYSTGMWLRAAEQALRESVAASRLPIFVGGTGLYFRALLGGLDEMPEIPAALRAELRERHARIGTAALHAELAERDPEAASRLRPSDSQRVVRALELVLAGGAPLSRYQAGQGQPVLEGRLRKIVLTPERAILRQRIADRFAQMMEEGAEAEAVHFAAMPGALEHSAANAIGVREILAAQRGEITRDQAVSQAITRTRQYAKRQETWFRNQFDATWERQET